MNVRRLALMLVVFGFAACSQAPEGRNEGRGGAPDAAADASDVSIDEVEIVSGVPDRNRDPAVVAIDIGGDALCTGALVSPRLVLTARHCVARTAETVECPARGAQVAGNRDARTLSILVGDDVSTARAVAHGTDIVAPSGATLCDADLALIVLDVPVTATKPLPIAKRGAARGERLRAVGFGKSGDRGSFGMKLVREHVRVISVSPAEFSVGEATCQGDSGGPALDEDTGEIVGVVSRGGPSCEGPTVANIYTRVDAFAWLVEEAFAKVATAHGGDAGTTTPAPRGSKEKPVSDMGGPCEKGSDCAAGVCVTDSERQYCSRPCGSGDRCPSRYNCKPSPSGGSVCINVR